MNLKKILYVYSHYFQKLSLKGGNKESLFFLNIHFLLLIFFLEMFFLEVSAIRLLAVFKGIPIELKCKKTALLIFRHLFIIMFD